jgi:tripartite-type tricarboxylate transporter receptor subunit TctC
MNNGAMTFIRALIGGLSMMAVAWPTLSLAENWPERPIKLIVPFPPGGSTDIAARLISTDVSKNIGQPVVLEYKPGAGTNIGSAYVAKAPPDGYTLLMGTSSMTINPSLYPDLGYDPIKDFVAVSNVAEMPLVLVANPEIKAENLSEFIAYAKSSGRPMNCGSSGTGSTTHLACLMLKNQTGIQLMHIPYKGSAPAITDLLGGRLDIVFDSPSVTLQYVEAGSMRALATTGPKRQEAFKDLATMEENGLANFEVVWWTGIVAPRDTPKEAVKRLNTEIRRAIALPQTAKRFSELGITPAMESQDAFADRIRNDARRWAKLVKETGAELD